MKPKNIFITWIACTICIICIHIYQFAAHTGSYNFTLKKFIGFYFKWDAILYPDILLVLFSSVLLFNREFRTKPVRLVFVGASILVILVKMVLYLVYFQRYIG